MNRALCIIVAAFACLLASAAQAQYRGGFFGLAAGPSKMSFASGSLQAEGATGGTLATQDSSTAFKGYGGFRFNPNFAVEGGLAYLGKFKATRTYTAPAGTLHADLDVIGGYVNAVGILPLGEHFEIFAKGGYMVTGVVAERSSTGAIILPNNQTTISAFKSGPHIGAGMEVRFDKKVGLILEYEQVWGVGENKNTGGGDIGTAYIGLTFRF